MQKQTPPVIPYRSPAGKATPQAYNWEKAPETREQVISLLKNSPLLYGSYQSLNAEWKQRFLDFCQGKKSLPLTYDPFFKRIFHPDVHPDRLSRLVSSILGITVKVLHILPGGADFLLLRGPGDASVCQTQRRKGKGLHLSGYQKGLCDRPL